MKVIVQKFGGTSVKDPTARAHAIRHVKQAIEKGYKVVVVVSAMGRKGDPYATDTLLSLVEEERELLEKRELDALLSTGELISSVVFSHLLKREGVQATSLSGAQAGFRTNADHTNAKLIDMKPERLLHVLERQDVVVVAGFQGVARNGDVTTIGRGGSDTSASALGVALQAESIDIFTDVDGIMTADPRLADHARPLSKVTYNEVCNMAYQGAKVIHPRAVEIAMQAKVPIRIRSTYSDNVGTLVTSIEQTGQARDVKERVITGIAHVANITQIRVDAPKDDYHLQSNVFKAMAQAQISVDFINISPNRVTYTVPEEATKSACNVLESLGYSPQIETGCAKVSVVGAGMTGVPGVTSTIVGALSDKGIRILQSADSHTTIWVLVKQEDLRDAVNALHDAFHLEEEPVQNEE
ncbi:aspartate kinase [Bacillus fonticola]|uniref:aspartate kinase n=1 Tax=Bacillus fonticola TaxID=2728853 RepID=UPI001474CB3D|nr:aspartate kinase [Bacillus fonticola]